MEAIKKLQEHNIFKRDSIVESTITKDWMGSPVEKKVHLIVRKVRKDDCLCEEYGEADGKAYKIKYLNICTIDGQEWSVPVSEGNRHYQEILAQVKAGTLTIKDAD